MSQAQPGPFIAALIAASAADGPTAVATLSAHWPAARKCLSGPFLSDFSAACREVDLGHSVVMTGFRRVRQEPRLQPG